MRRHPPTASGRAKPERTLRALARCPRMKSSAAAGRRAAGRGQKRRVGTCALPAGRGLASRLPPAPAGARPATAREGGGSRPCSPVSSLLGPAFAATCFPAAWAA